MRLMIPLFAMLAVRPEAGSCNGSAPHDPPADDGRIGVAGYPNGRGVVVEEIGVGTAAHGRIEPGEVILAVDGTPLSGPHAFWDLKRLAAGVPGTRVSLTVANHAGDREVTLTRTAFDDDVARRDGPLAPEALVDAALRDAGAMECPGRDGRPVGIRGEIVASQLQVVAVTSGLGGDDGTCAAEIAWGRAIPVAGGLRGSFEWAAWRVDEDEAHSETTVTPAPIPMAVTDAAPGAAIRAADL